METKLKSEHANQVQRGRSGAGGKFGSMLPEIDPFVPKTNCDPRELRNWAKRTGYDSGYSGATETSASERNESAGFDLEMGTDRHRGEGSSPKIEIDPFLGRTKQNRGAEIEAASGSRNGGVRDGNDGFVGLSNRNFRGENQRRRIGDEPGSIGRDAGRRDELNGTRNGSSQGNESLNEVVNNRTENVNGNGFGAVTRVSEPEKDYEKDDRDMEFNVQPEGDEPAYGGWLGPSSEMKCGLTENPGLVQLLIYGLQHYMSLAGSLIFIPLIIVPAMGGTDKDTATVISTMMLISGITTILHIYFGTRLPLVHGSSFIYLAPALVIMNAQEYRNLTEHIQLSGIAKFFRLPFIISLKFRHIMRELQGAIIVGSIFQSLLGFSGLMSIFLRLINPVVVAPTVAAVGLAFFSYGFPQAGSCVEISIPLILLILIFTLYLRGISISGHHFFRIYAVPVSVMIVWIYAFFLTAGGAYNYKGCSPDIPSSNILIDACKRHAYTMKHCRTDVSNAWRTAAWVRVPFPLQWGIPIFHMRTSIIMIFVSVIASVDSVGTYHTTALLINLKPPTPRIVSRGIALEGLCGMLAGLWGSGTGSSTLTENIHTIDTTKMASRRAVELGAVVLIIFSFIGKVGAILASIPLALAASTLCFIWALTVALGLSTLLYGQAASSRNIIIVGVSLFLGLSIPAYFQQYQPESSLILPSYFVPYGAASNGPVYTGSEQIDFALNGLMSMNMVVTFLVAFVLDNTVPGSRQERGVYEWSNAEDIRNDPSLLADYSLPTRVARCSLWQKCLGVS